MNNVVKRSPRVCMLQPYLTPYRQDLFNTFSDQLGGNLTMLYFAREESARKWSFERNVRFKEVSLKTTVAGTGYDTTRIRLSCLSLASALIKIRPDVVIANEGLPGKMVRLLQIILHFKLIFWSEGTEVTMGSARPKKWFMRWLDRGVSSYVIPGKLSERYLREIRGYQGPVYFAPNTIDRGGFLSTRKETVSKFEAEGPLRILFSGSLIPRKGIDTLLDSFERLAETAGIPAYRLDVAGEGPEEKRSIKNVYYHGYLSQDQCAQFMKGAHVFVLPSRWDCNPLVVTEAVTSGCVTVLSDGVGNYPEYTEGNGVVFERGNASALFNALMSIMSRNRDELLKMALRSLEIASTVSHENSAGVFSQAVTDAMTTIKRKK